MEGSSRKTTAGSVMRALPRRSRLCMPPEKWETNESLLSRSPTVARVPRFCAARPSEAVEHPVDEQVLPRRQLPVKVILLGHDADEPLDLGRAGRVEARYREGA